MAGSGQVAKAGEEILMAPERAVYRFDTVEVDAARFEVTREGRTLALEPKSIRVLLYLIEHRSRAIGKDELIQAVWQGNAVTDNALTRVVAQLRRELGDDARQPRYIQTIPTLGYRFIAGLRTPSAPLPRTPRRLAATAAAALLIAVAAAVPLWRRTPAPAVVAGPHVQITSSPGLDLSGSFSPDGRSLVYASDRGGRFEIYTRPLDGGSEVQITSDGGQNLDARWSPAGDLIVYHSAARGGLWLVPAAGGVPRRLTHTGSQPAWSPDGRSIAFRSLDLFSVSATDFMNSAVSAPISVVDVTSGVIRQIAPAASAQGFPTWLAKSGRVLFSRFAAGAGELWTVRPDGSGLRKIFTAPHSVFLAPAASPSGDSILYGALSKAREFGLWRAAVDPSGDALAGEPVEVARLGTSIPRSLAFSPDGRRIAYSSTSTSSTLWTLETGNGAAPRPLYNHVVFRSSFPVFSPDGKRIAFFARLFGGLGDIWVMNADGTGAAPVTSSRSQDLLPSWTPDGASIVYTRASESGPQLWQISLAGRVEKPLLDGRIIAGWPRLAPDGRTIVYHAHNGGVTNIWTTDLASGASRQLTRDAEGAGYPAWSRDGKYIGYEVLRGRNSYLAMMNRDGTQQVQLNADPGHSWLFDWSAGNAKILYAGFRSGVWNLWCLDRATGRQQRLTSYESLASYVRYPSWSPAGDRIVFEYAVTRGNVYTFDLR